ncbi:hypothetical protein N9V90_01730 [Endozoicomonas sp.]|nr:hypothetical protein [Endozoicomonas sp.]
MWLATYALKKTYSEHSMKLGSLKLKSYWDYFSHTPIVVDKQNWSYKGKVLKHYEFLSGRIALKRPAYQDIRGVRALTPCRLRKVWLSRPYTSVRRSFAKFPETARFCAIAGAVYETSGLMNYYEVLERHWPIGSGLLRRLARRWSSNGYIVLA